MAKALRVPTLKARERRRIENHARRSRDPQYTDRLRAVLWSERGLTPLEIARLVGRNRSTVQRWLHDYLRFGLRGLEVGKSPGAPRRIDADGEACLRKALAANPRDVGYRFTRWTQATLAEHLYREVHTRVSLVTLSRALHRLRYSYKRPKLSLKHRQKPWDVRRARAARNAALKKPADSLNASSSFIRTNASSISIPA